MQTAVVPVAVWFCNAQLLYASRGYWQKEANVQREVRAWMAKHKLADRLPTNRQLRDSGNNSLAIAISKFHGGYVAFGKRMG